MTLISVGGAVMGDKYPLVAFGGISASSCWNPLQDGIDCSELRETVKHDITHANMQFFESLHSSS